MRTISVDGAAEQALEEMSRELGRSGDALVAEALGLYATALDVSKVGGALILRYPDREESLEPVTPTRVVRAEADPEPAGRPIPLLVALALSCGLVFLVLLAIVAAVVLVVSRVW